MSITCPHCQKQVPEGTPQCPHCRKALGRERAERRGPDDGDEPDLFGSATQVMDVSAKRWQVGSSGSDVPSLGPAISGDIKPPDEPTDDPEASNTDHRHSTGGPGSSVGLAAAELWLALRQVGQDYAAMRREDQITSWAAVGLILANLLPFVGVPGDPYRPGLLAGGWVLVGLAVWSVWLCWVRTRALSSPEQTLEMTDQDADELRRINLLHLLCGALASGYIGYLVLLYGWIMEVRTITGERMNPIPRAGLAVALFFATGLAYSGWARFRADARERNREPNESRTPEP